MSLDLHSALIEQLKPLLMEPDFNELFENLTAEESNSTRFLLKMELSRLGSPCTRIIDLRHNTQLNCEVFEFGQQTHFIDLAAKESFLAALALYRDKYTLGVYEQVIAAHKSRQRQARQTQNAVTTHDKARERTKAIVLGHHLACHEERLHYSMKVEVTQAAQQYPGITSDVSVSGATIRLPATHALDPKLPIEIKFLELSDNYYHDDLQQGMQYQIVEINSNQQYHWLKVSMISNSKTLTSMLEKLIERYKHHYKIDANDVLSNATSLGFERHYLPHLAHLSVFVEQKEVAEQPPQYSPTHVLLGRDNQTTFHYFNDEAGVNQLNGMLSSARLKAMINAEDLSPHHLFFCFTFQVKGCKYFYSASAAELDSAQLQALFLSFGATKPSWRVFRVATHTIDHQQPYRAGLLPGDNNHYSPLTETQLAAFSHVIQLIDITNHSASEQYQAWSALNTHSVNELKIFGQKKLLQSALKPVSLQFSERRNETRFAFKTAVILSQGDVSTTAYTQDISSKGMQLIAENAVNFNLDDTIAVSFPKLQTIAGKTSLQQLPYRLIRTRKNGVTLHLAAQISRDTHVGVEFLNRLIEHNQEKFDRLSEHNHEQKELAEGMRNILMRKLVSLPFYLEKSASSAYVSTIGVSKKQQAIAKLFACVNAPLEYDLSPLFQSDRLKRDIINPIRKMKPQHGMSFYEIYLQLTPSSSGHTIVCTMTGADISAPTALLTFIQQGQAMGEFLALRVCRGAVGKPDLAYIRRELDYINLYAPHQAKKLEEQLWRIIGVGELIDITQEVLLRFATLSQRACTTH